MKKWNAVKRALIRLGVGAMRGTSEVLRHNSPTYDQVYNHFNTAFNKDNMNMTQGGSLANFVRLYFIQHPNKRQNISSAYNKLNNMARELGAIRRKAVAARKIQQRWRAEWPRISNNRKIATLITLSRFPGDPNTRRKIFENAFPRPVYGPNTEENTLKKIRSRKYNKY